MDRHWIIAPAGVEANNGIRWAEICGLPCIVELLKRKRFSSSDEVDAFLVPRLRSLSDPFLLPNMEAAVTRIFQAIDRGERIVLFGDYDVDGVTSLALLAEMLRTYGSTPELFLPLRMEEGYGLSPESVERCCQEHRPQLLIAVDCGTSSLSEIASLKERGVDVIVLDHHEPKSALPDCVAVVNPKADSKGALEYLCSVGIVFKLCHALLKTRPVAAFDLKAHLDLVALGTVADIVPLEKENRIFVQRGMRELATSKRLGVRKLMEISAVRVPVAAEHIGFRLGPRLNAAGRLATAEKALRLLLTSDEQEAEELAAFLDGQNRERQAVERAIYDEAEKELKKTFDSERDAAIVLGSREWHPGVLGIVASRLARKYHRPTILVAFDPAGSGKGSGRSIEGLSLVEALDRCAAHLEKFGGHEMAAGLAVREEKFTAFSEAFRQTARDLLSDEDLQPRLHLDHELSFSELNDHLLRWHQALEPFGNGNVHPLFFARGVAPAAEPQVLKEKHLVLRLRQQNHFRRAIFFDGAAASLPTPPWDIAFRVTTDEYEGETRLQIQVEAIRGTVPTE
ncbi:MAG TPA: single-stranded-DNA-specific exonuclease RecJ [Chthoniobacterales bacterium]|nr:single-stranded-DNA-specific exonuclease RecJ [Chthoniobacterales bacterium]